MLRRADEKILSILDGVVEWLWDTLEISRAWFCWSLLVTDRALSFVDTILNHHGARNVYVVILLELFFSIPGFWYTSRFLKLTSTRQNCLLLREYWRNSRVMVNLFCLVGLLTHVFSILSGRVLPCEPVKFLYLMSVTVVLYSPFTMPPDRPSKRRLREWARRLEWSNSPLPMGA